MSFFFPEEVNPSNQMRQLGFLGSLRSNFGGSQIASRKQTYIEAQNNQSQAPGGKLTFQFQRDGYLDPQTVAFVFDLSVTPDTVSAGSLNQVITFLQYGVSDLIARFRMYFMGGSDLENVDEYNRIKANLLLHNNTAQWLQTSGSILEGTNHGWQAAQASGPGVGSALGGIYGKQWWKYQNQHFFHTFMSGFMFSDQYIPTFLLPNLMIELYLATFANCFVSATNDVSTTINFNTGTFLITNSRIYYDVVYLKSDAQQQVLNVLASADGWKMHYQTWQTYFTQGISTVNSNPQFSVRAGSIKSVMFLGAPSNWESTQFDYLKSTFTNLSSVQFKVNNTYYPLEQMQDVQTIYRYFTQSIGVYNTMYRGGVVCDPSSHSLYNLDFVSPAYTGTLIGPGAGITPNYTSGLLTSGGVLNDGTWGVQFPGQNCTVGLDFDLENDEGIISGLSTNTTGADMVVLFNRSGLPPLTGVAAQVGLDCFLCCFIDAIVTIKGNGDAAAVQIDR